MESKGRHTPTTVLWGISLAVALVLLCASVAMVRVLLRDDGDARKRPVCQVMLMKPPPPPKIERRPPEPEIEKVEMEAPEEEAPEEAPQESDDAPPPGDDLGLDADGSGSGDGFGLKAKKGGRALLAGDFGQQALLRKYAWYVRILQEEIGREVRAYRDRKGGSPDQNLEALVEITVDPRGRIRTFHVLGLSGHSRVDEAVHEALRLVRISEPPPEGMPRTMKLKIASHG